jgi:hypothetical protein
MKKYFCFFVCIFLLSCNNELSDIVTTNPSNFVASRGDSIDKIVVKWNIVQNAEKYQLFRFDIKTRELKLLTITPDTQFVDTGIVSIEKVYYKMRTFYSDKSFSNLSDSIYGYTHNYPNNYPPYYLFASKGKSDKKITLYWEKTSTGQFYEIFKYDPVSSQYKLLATITESSYVDSIDLIPYTNYSYKVRAINTDKEYSNFCQIDSGYICKYYYDLKLSFNPYGNEILSYTTDHIEVDKNDNIYLTDNHNNKILKFDKNGNFIETFFTCYGPRTILFLNDRMIVAKSGENKIYEMDYNKNFIFEWGSAGTGDGQFNFFRQIAVDDEKNIYVVDINNKRIQKFDINGNFITKWSTEGDYPWGVAYINNKILVSNGNIVNIFSKTGTFIKNWNFDNIVYDIKVKGNDIYFAQGDFVIKTNENRDYNIEIGRNTLYNVNSMAIGSDNTLYIICSYGLKVFIYKPK